MSAGEVVFARLASATDAESRVYPLVLPQEPTFPAITYQVISSTPLHAMGRDTTTTRARVQVNVWGRSYAEAVTIAQAAARQLSRYRGAIGSTSVLDVLLDNEMMTYESDSNTRRVMQDYTLFLVSTE